MKSRFEYTFEGFHKEEDDPVKHVVLGLRPDGTGGVDLVTLNALHGDIEQYVLTITNDGRYSLHEEGNFAGVATDDNPFNVIEKIGDGGTGND